jgi:nitroreductase
LQFGIISMVEKTPMEPLTLFEAIRTQRAIRHFRTDPIRQEDIDKILDAAVHAPSGGNNQRWAFIVISDPDIKRKIGEIYLDGWNRFYYPTMGKNLPPSIQGPAHHLAFHIHEAPILILACLNTGPAKERRNSIMRGASIYPAVQNILLTARALGLGTTLTTMYQHREDDIKTLLSIPQEVETAALIPIGIPADGHEFVEGRRNPASEVTFYNQWGIR